MRIYGQQVSKGQAHGILDRFAYSQVTEDFCSHILSSGAVTSTTTINCITLSMARVASVKYGIADMSFPGYPSDDIKVKLIDMCYYYYYL